MLTRVAASHIRVGTFQFFAARGDTEAVRTLADYVIARHGPDAPVDANPYRALLDAVVGRQASLVARWLLVGFIHGVMNTDNTSVSGETIDYGPCAFMDGYDPATVFSSIDLDGRYAYANQPRIMHWNLARLAECLLPLLGGTDEDAHGLGASGPRRVRPALPGRLPGGLRRKIGLQTEQDGDDALTADLLAAMAETRADFTLTFRRLATAAATPAADPALHTALGDAYAPWATRWRARLQAEPGGPAAGAAAMVATNPAVIPRNHLVEAALAAATAQDFGPFDALLEAVTHPFDTPADGRLALAPEAVDMGYQTFCGT